MEVGRTECGGKGMPVMAKPVGFVGWGGITEGGTGAGGAPDRNPSIREWPCVAFLSSTYFQAVDPAAKKLSLPMANETVSVRTRA
jgi:hypothetical protein